MKKQAYRCRYCGKVLFCLVDDRIVEIKRGEQEIKFTNSQSPIEVLCGRCKRKNLFVFSEGNDAER